MPATCRLRPRLLLGVLGGRLTGALGGALMAFPAFLHGEWATLPSTFSADWPPDSCAALAQDKEDVWSFSPFIDLSIYRWIRRNLPKPRFDWQIMFFATIVGLRFLHSELTRCLPAFHLQPGEFRISG